MTMTMTMVAENTLRYDKTLCIGCGMCSEVCPHGIFVAGRPATLSRPETCMECGACALNCPVGAIEVDSGTGCASAMIRSALTGKEVTCGPDCCGPSSSGPSCC